ncbi:MAG: type II secretion system protein [Kiloniellales bacterium]|nr:type II secretion system protein [Kiloniellales bacterium]
MPSDRKVRPGERGFTLFEVLIAFTIFAFSFGAILQVFSSGARNAGVARAYAVALGHAQSQLERLGIEEPLETGQSSGVLDGGMAWRLEVAPYEEQPSEDSLLRAFLVKATVTWRDGGQERAVTLSSLRLRGTQ